MSDRFESLQRRCPYPLSRGVSRDLLRILVLQLNQFIKKPIIVSVRNLWLIQDVIEVVVVVDLFAKCPDPIGDFCD
jgi:hypothetical protein